MVFSCFPGALQTVQLILSCLPGASVPLVLSCLPGASQAVEMVLFCLSGAFLVAQLGVLRNFNGDPHARCNSLILLKGWLAGLNNDLLRAGFSVASIALNALVRRPRRRKYISTWLD